MSMHGHSRSYKVNCHVHNSDAAIQLVFERPDLGSDNRNNTSFSFSFFLFFRWHPLKYSSRTKTQEIACPSWRSALDLCTGKRKEYTARGTYRSEYKTRDVAGKFNI